MPNFAFFSHNPNSRKALNYLNYMLMNIGTSSGTGTGPTATNATVEAAVEWLVNKASTGLITYSQPNRNLKNPNGTSYDCSSFIITGFYAVGLNVNATWTGDMKEGFVAAGFVWHTAGSNRRLESSELQRGDILLNISNHTQMYIGNNQDVNCGSTPARVMTHTPYYYYSGASTQGWDGYLRYGG